MSQGTAFKDLQSRSVTIGDARWDRTTKQLTIRGEPAKLTWRAAAAFSLLVEARGAVVTREEFERQVWGNVQMDYSVVSQCIKSLRRVLDPAPGGESYIETVARAGYRLAVEVVEEPESTPLPASPSLPASPPRRLPVWLSLAGLLAFLAAGLAGLFFYRHSEKRHQADLLVERGFQTMRRGTIASGTEATAMFREALTLIPDYPPATAGLAEAASRLGNGSFDHALTLARRAVDADPSCGECQSVLGQILGVRMWRWQEAGRHLQRAVELNPTRVTYRIFLTEWLMIHGRLDEAARHAEEATRLEPATQRCWTILAAVRYFQRRYDDSVREADRSASLDPQHPSAPLWSYHSHMMLGDERNAVIGRAKMLATNSGDPNRTFLDYSDKFFAVLAKSGRRGIARLWIDDVSNGRAMEVHRYNRALWFAWIGEYDAALTELEAGVKSRPYQMIWTAVEPAFLPLRANPRFHKVVRDLGLPVLPR